jgi:hypothetical protein
VLYVGKLSAVCHDHFSTGHWDMVPGGQVVEWACLLVWTQWDDLWSDHLLTCIHRELITCDGGKWCKGQRVLKEKIRVIL